MARRAASVRLFLLAQAAALAAASAALLLGLGLPLLARRAVSPRVFGALVAADAAFVLGVGVFLLWRSVARPIDRLMAAAERLGQAALGDRPGLSSPPDLPILGEPGEGGAALSRAAVAFERVAAALGDERARLAAKVAELTEANRALSEAREALVRSEKLATVGRLASGVAHEVGNPLGAISGYVEVARGRLPPGSAPELEGYLARIGAEARRIDRTVRELLDFARPAAPALAPIDFRPPLEAALRLARMQSRFRSVEVDLDLPATLPRVVADEHQLSQVLLNLFLNAGDAMGGAGRMRVAARTASAEAGGPPWVEAEVADNGPGIPPADLPRVFDPFFTTKEPGRGTGLGLAICHRIMESFGGEIAARNGPRGGATFTLRFRPAPEGPAGRVLDSGS